MQTLVNLGMEWSLSQSSSKCEFGNETLMSGGFTILLDVLEMQMVKLSVVTGQFVLDGG